MVVKYVRKIIRQVHCGHGVACSLQLPQRPHTTQIGNPGVAVDGHATPQRRPGQAPGIVQWLITPHADRLYEFMAHRGILLRLFAHNSSVRFGLPADEADWQRLELALAAYTKETT